jgi:type IV secretion system protein VirB5
MDLQARISAESAMIQNEQVRLQGLAMMQHADERMQEQREREERAQRHSDAQAIWKGMYER